MTTFLLAMVILLVLVVPLIAVARLANHLPRAVDQAVTQGMQTQAGGAAEPLAVLPGIERPAAAQPTLALVSADNADVHSMAARRRWELHALGILRRLLQVDLVATLGYALLPGLACGFSDVDTSFTGLALGLLLAVVALARYGLARKRTQAYDLTQQEDQRPRHWWRRAADWLLTGVAMVIGACLAIAMVVLNLPVGLVGSAGTVLGLRARLLLSGVVMLVAVAVTFTTPAPLAGAGMAAAVLLHAALLYRQLRLMRAEPGIALLVLRVFNHDTATGFTFNGLLQFWRHFGLHFTVVDTALVRVVSQPKLGWTRGAILAIVLIVMGFSAVLFIAADSADGAGNFPVAKLVLAAAAALVQAAVAALVVWAVIAFARQRVRRRFVRSMAQLQARVDNLTHRPRHPDMSFRHERALCPSDIWFMAVGNFARAAQVVLMDLRGYSSARKGCQKEVDFLFDTVPAERIVFLLDLHSDRDAVQQMLLARWAMQRADSPNLHAAAPVLQIYLAQAADNRDMQGVLDLLITAADRPVPARHGTPGPE